MTASTGWSALKETSDRIRDRINALDARTDVQRLSLIVAALSYVWIVRSFSKGDAFGYWEAYRWSAPYANGLTGYLYSPAFLQFFTPLLLLRWGFFYAIWLAGLTGLLLFMAGPTIGIVLLCTTFIPDRFAFFPFDIVRHYLSSGNIFLIMSFCAVIGFRWPAAWAFNILTKVSSGVALVWFPARREWRSLAAALGATVAIAAISFALAPGLWFDWIHLLASNVGAPEPAFAYHILPPVPRIILAAILTIVAARFDARWVVPIAAMIALPYIPLTGLIMPVGAIPLWLDKSWTRPGPIHLVRRISAVVRPAGA